MISNPLPPPPSEEDGDHEKKKIWYYSTKAQLEELLESLDKEYWEMDLCATLEEMREEVQAHMDVTEELTNRARGNNKAYLGAVDGTCSRRRHVTSCVRAAAASLECLRSAETSLQTNNHVVFTAFLCPLVCRAGHGASEGQARGAGSEKANGGSEARSGNELWGRRRHQRCVGPDTTSSPPVSSRTLMLFSQRFI